MRERGLSVDHTTVWRWVQRYASEINKRIRPHLKMGGTSYRIDETYVKVSTEWKYLYRAVDSSGCTIAFMLSAKRGVSAAKRFFKKLMRPDHRRLPFTIGTDKHASYPEAFSVSVKEKVLPPDCKLRRVKYLNNVIEQDHRFIRRRWRAMQCFRTIHAAERTIEGIEAARRTARHSPTSPAPTPRQYKSRLTSLPLPTSSVPRRPPPGDPRRAGRRRDAFRGSPRRRETSGRAADVQQAFAGARARCAAPCPSTSRLNAAA